MERVVVVGPGAIGLLLAASFARAGIRVRLLDYRPERARKIDAEGVTVIDAAGASHRYQIPCSTGANSGELATHAFLAVKAHDTERAVIRVLDLLAPSGVLVSFQNGIRHVELIREYLPTERTVFGATAQGATRIATGRVRHCGSGETIIAAEDRNRDGVAEVADLLNRTEIHASVGIDLPFILWRKLLLNAAINPVTAILGIRNGKVTRIPGAWELAAACFREAREVAGLAVGPEIGQVTEDDLRELCEKTAENVSSMLQDVRSGRRTEIHALNGVVVEEAGRHGRDAPVNRVVVQLVTALEEARR